MDNSGILDKSLAEASAPYGRRKDGKPKLRPGRDNISRYNRQRQAQKDTGQAPPPPSNADSTAKVRKQLEKALTRLGKEAIDTLRAGLRDPDPKVRLQAAAAATRTSLLGLAKDAWLGDGLAEIHIHTTDPDPGIHVDAEGEADPGHDQPPRTGKPVTIVR